MKKSLNKAFVKLIWFDSNVFNKDNSFVFNDLLQIFPKSERFDNPAAAAKKIISSTDKIIVISSGSKGKELVQVIHECSNIIAIVIFCGNVEFHKGWTKDFSKVHSVINSGLKETVLGLFEDKILADAFEVAAVEHKELGLISNAMQKLVFNNEIDLKGSRKQYTVSKEELSLEFFLIYELVRKQLANPNSKVKEELISLNPYEKNKIENIFKDRKNLLEAIIYTYTTDAVYQQFNSCLAEQQYNKIIYTISSSVNEIEKNKKLTTKNLKVYRGINRRFEDHLHQIGSELYWPSFSSTTPDFKVSDNFSGKTGTIFEITLDSSDPYFHISVPKQWSAYPMEKEVLLLPFFPFTIVNISSFNEKQIIS